MAFVWSWSSASYVLAMLDAKRLSMSETSDLYNLVSSGCHSVIVCAGLSRIIPVLSISIGNQLQSKAGHV